MMTLTAYKHGINIFDIGPEFCNAKLNKGFERINFLRNFIFSMKKYNLLLISSNDL